MRRLRGAGGHDAEEPQHPGKGVAMQSAACHVWEGPAASGGGVPDTAGVEGLLALRPGKRLLAGQQPEEDDGLHRAGQGGLVDVAAQYDLGGAEGPAVDMGDDGIAFKDEAPFFRSQGKGPAAAFAFQP